MLALLAGVAAIGAVRAKAEPVLILGFEGRAAGQSQVEEIREALCDRRLAGIVLYRRNITSPAQLKALIDHLTACEGAQEAWIAIDQEGGRVMRLEGALARPSAAWYGAESTPSEAALAYRRLAEGLAELGITLNFGPVVDLAINPSNPIIAGLERAYGDNAEQVTRFAEAFISGHAEAGVATALKHFPGHGSSQDDTHEGFVDVTDYWQPEELAPYQTLIAQGYDGMVMMSHLVQRRFMPSGEPASLAPAAYAWLDAQGFTGMTVTDDLLMGAIQERYGVVEAGRLALAAGADLLLYSSYRIDGVNLLEVPF